MDDNERSKVVKFLLTGSLLCLVGMFFSFYLKGFVLYGSRFGRKHKIIGATYMTLNNQFYDALNSEIQQLVEDKGDHLITLDPALDQEKQNEQIDYLIKQGADVIILNPVDWKGVQKGLEEAKKNGIPVIVVDTEVYDTDLVDVTIVTDNYQAGVLCAKNMMERRKEANIVLLTHDETKSGKDRIQGFMDTIQGHRSYKVIATEDTQGQIERSLPKVEKVVESHSDIDVIMALNDPTAMGALAALDSKNYKENVLVYGVDGSPEGKKLISEGKMTGTALQYPRKMGREAVKAAYALLSGEDVEKKVTIPVELITKENVDKYDLDRWQ